METQGFCPSATIHVFVRRVRRTMADACGFPSAVARPLAALLTRLRARPCGPTAATAAARHAEPPPTDRYRALFHYLTHSNIWHRILAPERIPNFFASIAPMVPLFCFSDFVSASVSVCHASLLHNLFTFRFNFLQRRLCVLLSFSEWFWPRGVCVYSFVPEPH